MESRSKVTSMRLGQVAGWLEPEALQEFRALWSRSPAKGVRYRGVRGVLRRSQLSP